MWTVAEAKAKFSEVIDNAQAQGPQKNTRNGRQAVVVVAAGRRHSRLDAWLADELLPRFEGRILSIGPGIADLCGRVVARREAMGRPIHAMNALIAATATSHDLTLVTRNSTDFETSVKSILNPWS
jgi:prevent-host-death family protein